MSEANGKKIQLTKKDITRTSFWWMNFQRISQCFERYYGLGTCIALMPVLKKLYPDKKDLSEALTRHMATFVTDPCFGSAIVGLAVALEEEKANGADISGDTINALKSGLMGPVAGFGDAFNWATMAPIIRALFIPYAIAGSALGLLAPIGIPLYGYTVSYFSTHFGYKQGKKSINNILKSGLLQQVMVGATVLGAFMMGVLTISYVAVNLIPEWTMSTGTINLQGTIDGIFPGILPIALTFGIYKYLDKGGKNVYAIIAIVVLALLGSIIGLF